MAAPGGLALSFASPRGLHGHSQEAGEGANCLQGLWRLVLVRRRNL